MRLTLPGSVPAPASVTVVIPCYNYGHFLPAAVHSVLDQRDVDAHVVIVDDASPDGSADIAARLAAEHPTRVRAVLHERNTGHIATYNDGFDHVETEFVTLVSADDLVASGALGRATRLMQRNPGVGLVYGHAESFEQAVHGAADLAPKHRPLPETWTVWGGREWIRWSVRRGRNFILSPEAVLRTAALRAIGGYDPALPHSGDLHYWLRTAAHWDVGRVNGSPQAWYRVHGSNMHLTDFATLAVDLRHRLAAFEVLADPDRGLPDGSRLVDSARRALAREALLNAARELDEGADVAAVAPLHELALELRPAAATAARTRAVDARMRRRELGHPPTARERAIEHARRTVDRVRWRIWETAGIS